MSRWHKADCKAPDVVVGDTNDATPHCRACDASPPLKEMIEAAAHADPLPPRPENEPLDQMNLHWPPQVPWIDQQPPSVSSLTVTAAAEERCALRPSYGSTLGSDEFRLLRLAASPACAFGTTWPIHCHLETYDRASCPDYEAISYTWGGENNDSRRRQPIYIGPHWDVLLQTQNCWDMLQHMRPRDGLRRIWVDAICINQINVTERNQQVQAMSDIYRQCLRVVVYLGADIALPVAGSKNGLKCYPARRDLNQLGAFAGDLIKINELLRRRYFSRVWIVQELILPQLISMRVGVVDYSVNALTFERLARARNSESEGTVTAASWLESACQGALQYNNVFKKLNTTWACKAGDPRDRIFGIMALLDQSSYPGQPELSANYSISEQHVFTGFFAYQLTVREDLDVLLHAVGAHGWGRLPSLIPDWQSPRGPTRQIREGYWNEKIYQCVNDVGDEEFESHSGFRRAAERKMSLVWGRSLQRHKMGVSSATGSLSMNCLHLFHLPLGQIRVSQAPQNEKLAMYRFSSKFPQQEYSDYPIARGEPPVFRFRSDDAFYLIGTQGLDSILDVKEDHLFMVNRGPAQPMIPVVLRPCDQVASDLETSQLPPRWRLVASFSALYIHPGGPYERNIYGDEGYNLPYLSRRDRLRSRPESHSFIQKTIHLCATFELIKTFPFGAFPPEFTADDGKSAVALLQAFIDEDSGLVPSGAFLERLIAAMDPKKKPSVSSVYFKLAPGKQWQYSLHRIRHPGLIQGVKEWLRQENKRGTNPQLTPEDHSLLDSFKDDSRYKSKEWEEGHSGSGAILSDRLLDQIRKFHSTKCMKFLGNITKKRAVDVLETRDMLSNERFPYLLWPVAAIEGLDLDGGHYDIEIF